MPSISTSQMSPAFMKTGGLRAAPTPAGVPVMMRSPGSSVIASLMSATNVATSKIRSAVVALCMTRPLSRVSIFKPCAPGGSSSALTKTGPNGPVLSKFLPTVHCGVRS